MKTLAQALLILALSVQVQIHAQSALSMADIDQPFDPKTASFVTREGHRLMLDGKEYRFLSVNIPNYHIVEDPAWEGGTPWHRVTAFEQRDAARAVRYLGGRVFRIYVPSVAGGQSVQAGLAHVWRNEAAKVEYQEELWQDLDRGLAIAASEGVRVIIPLVDNWNSFGGHLEWAKLAGVYNFWDKAKSREVFKGFITWLLNRTNTVTGLKYKDDPTILAWELGNEIRLSTPEWCAEMSAHIKSLDPKHLVMDGGYTWVRPDNLRNPNIDMVTTHYTNEYLEGFIQEAQAAGKVFVYGEFEPKNATEVAQVADLLTRSSAAGGLVWSLRFRTESGGFYFHGDFGTSDSLQYPGFPGNGPQDEPQIFKVLKDYAWKIRGHLAPADPIPAMPRLFRSPTGQGLAWQGSVGALGYDLEEADTPKGPWQEKARGLSDCVPAGDRARMWPAQPMYGPVNLAKGKWYRLVAVNASGRSEPSVPFQYD